MTHHVSQSLAAVAVLVLVTTDSQHCLCVCVVTCIVLYVSTITYFISFDRDVTQN